jgi:hypothetical protein
VRSFGLNAEDGIIGGDWVPISANAGANLWMAQQDGLHTNFPPPVPGPNNLGSMTAWFQAEAERREGHALTPAEADRYWSGQARTSITGDPRSAVDRTVRRLLLALSTQDVQDHYDWRSHRRDQAVLGALPDFGWVLPGLTVVGIILVWRQGKRREALLLGGTVLAVAVSLAPFVVVERYRLPGAVAALPLAAAAVVGMTRERRWAVVALAVSLLASVDPFRGTLVLPDPIAFGRATSWTEASGPGREADEASNLAAAFLAAGDDADAEASLRNATTVQAGRTGDTVNLAALLDRRGAHDEALTLLRAHVKAHATDVEATLALCGLLLTVPADASEAVRTCTIAGQLAPTRWETLYQAAMAYWQVGDVASARTTLQVAAKLHPENVRVAAALKALPR